MKLAANSNLGHSDTLIFLWKTGWGGNTCSGILRRYFNICRYKASPYISCLNINLRLFFVTAY